MDRQITQYIFFILKIQLIFFSDFSKGKRQDAKKASQDNASTAQQIFSQPSSSADDKLRDDVLIN